MTDVFKPRVLQIQEEAARLTGISVPRMRGEERNAEVSRARFAAVWVIREHYGMSLPHIGRHFGNRDHTTIWHACKRAETMRVQDASFKWLCDQLEDAAKQPTLRLVE